jgi:23S rRNA (guanosine2251-2'-O)-methyltransferase
MKENDKPNEYWIPGIRAVEMALQQQPERLIGLWYSGEHEGARGRLIERAEAFGVPTHSTTMRKLSEQFQNVQHQGVAARVHPTKYADWGALLTAECGLLVAIDQVTDPRNFGAILRSAEAMGATGALTTSNRAARLGPTVSKTSAGASELLPVAMVPNLARALRQAQTLGYQVIGADLDGQSPSTLDFTSPTVIVIGGEGKGLRRLTKDLCDGVCTIPTPGRVQSLNAASAASILFYEALRQRSQ